MDRELELDEAVVRAVAAALTNSASELALLAERLDATLVADHGRLSDVVREWAQRTAADSSRLTEVLDRYTGQDVAAGATLERFEP